MAWMATCLRWIGQPTIILTYRGLETCMVAFSVVNYLKQPCNCGICSWFYQLEDVCSAKNLSVCVRCCLLVTYDVCFCMLSFLFTYPCFSVMYENVQILWGFVWPVWSWKCVSCPTCHCEYTLLYTREFVSFSPRKPQKNQGKLSGSTYLCPICSWCKFKDLAYWLSGSRGVASSGTVFEWNVVISIEFNSMSEKITSNRSFSGTHLYLVVYGSRIKSFFIIVFQCWNLSLLNLSMKFFESFLKGATAELSIFLYIKEAPFFWIFGSV